MKGIVQDFLYAPPKSFLHHIIIKPFDFIAQLHNCPLIKNLRHIYRPIGKLIFINDAARSKFQPALHTIYRAINGIPHLANGRYAVTPHPWSADSRKTLPCHMTFNHGKSSLRMGNKRCLGIVLIVNDHDNTAVGGGMNMFNGMGRKVLPQ